MCLVKWGLWPRQSKEVDIAQIKKFLEQAKPDSLVTSLYEFGVLRLEGSTQRGIALDSKVVGLLGWLGASTTVLVSLGSHELSRLKMVSLDFFVGGIVFAFLGLAIRSSWKFPSEQDWFKEEIRQNEEQLRRFYVLSLLHSCRNFDRITASKGVLATWAQVFAVVGWLTLAVSVLL